MTLHQRCRFVLPGLALIAMPLLAPSATLAAHGTESPPLTLSPERLQLLRDVEDQVVLVDLRPREAYLKVHVRGARSLPLDELRRRIHEVPRTGRVVLYGNSSDEATAAYNALRGLGYRNVMVLQDGIAGWVGRGLPVETAN